MWAPTLSKKQNATTRGGKNRVHAFRSLKAEEKSGG